MFQVLRNSMSLMISDIYDQTIKNIKINNYNSIEDIQKNQYFVVSFSKDMKKNCDTIKCFLFDNVYNHKSLKSKRQNVENIIIKLFKYFYINSTKLPLDWRANKDLPIERIICDYISGMTDRYASRLYKNIYD